MTPRERAVAALELRTPDLIPHFELEFQLTDELLERPALNLAWHPELLEQASATERERLIRQNVEEMLEIVERLEYSIVNAHWLGGPEGVRYFRQLTGDRYMLWAHCGGTFSIPDGAQLEEMSYRIADEPEILHSQARQMVTGAIEGSKRWMDAGVDCFAECADYCFNNGPFLSPRQFREFVTPYLAELIDGVKGLGAYVIKHTDGDIMPIIDQLVECKPHALHSLDPMAGVDIAEVKRLYGSQLCLIGNVNCALMQTGSREEIVASAEYALTHGKPGGGYIFSTSNVAFKGMPLENYLLILDVWKQQRQYI